MPTGFGRDFNSQYQKCQWEAIEYRGRKYEAALYEKKGHIATITMNRPEKRNAINDQLINDILAGLHQANDDPEVRVVVIKGAGTCFSSGFELSSPEGNDVPPVSPALNPTIVDYYGFERRRCTKWEDLFNFPKATIAQVHGYCVGGGEIMAACCDITITAEDAQFGLKGFERMPHGVTNWPIWPLGSYRLNAGQLLSQISGQDAAEIGLANKAVPLEKLEAEVAKWAHALSQIPTEVFAIAKEWMNGTLDITGMGGAWRSHFGAHTMLQFVRFRPGEVNLYKVRGAKGLKGFFADRATAATPNRGKGGG